MTDERRKIIEGIRNAIGVIVKVVEGESLVEAIVRYGDEDKVTIEEALEITGESKTKAA